MRQRSDDFVGCEDWILPVGADSLSGRQNFMLDGHGNTSGS
jgi:hypothetical protein